MYRNIKCCLAVLFCFLMLSGCEQKISETQIVDLTTNDRDNPIGLDESVYFSWKMQASEEGQKQSAYQIFVSTNLKKLEKGSYVWNSGKIISGESVAIPYDGLELEPEKEYVWKVKVWDKEQKVAESSVATFEMGKMSDVWEATEWITFGDEEEKRKGIRLKDISEISYEFKMEKTRTGLILGTQKGEYGEYYKWEIDVTGEDAKLIISHMDFEQEEEPKVEALLREESEKFLEQKHTISIQIKDGVATTYLDGTMVSEKVELQEFDVEEIGLWVTRGQYKAWYDNIVVKNLDGEVFFQEDFELQENMFSPFYVKIEDGMVRADSGYTFSAKTNKPAPMFRKNFATAEGKGIEEVRLYAAALGIYEIYVNGIDINHFYAAPGQSVYSEEVYYQTYDLTEHIKNGENAIGIMLGHGRYDRAKGKWGDRLALYAQIVIQYEDGTRQIVGTDETWSVCVNGPIRNDDIYNGEYYDANYEIAGWTQEDFAEEASGDWSKACIYNLEKEPMKKAVLDNGIKCIDKITPILVTEPEEGVYVYDFGQNFNGVCSLRLFGQAGDVITMRHGEYLNHENLQEKDGAEGTIWTRNLLTADNTDYYIFRENGMVVYTPTFSYRGFRYLQITGIDAAIPLDDIEGWMISTDNVRNGYFECSDENMNRLYNAIYLSQLSNYVDIPTDCPQRDERLGWTGDAQVFSYTGSLNANTANFIYKFIDMMRVSQNEDGTYPQIIPYVSKVGGANGWSDAGIILVWEMYQQYGNELVIEKNLDAMCRYMDYLVEQSQQFVREGEGYNDHNALSYMEDACCNTAQCTYVAKLLSKMCEVVGETQLAAKYREIYDNYLLAWQSHFLNEDGSIGNWLQSEYALALAYGLYPKELEVSGAEKLNISVEAGDYRAITGYITTPHILSMLCKYGYVDTAYKMIQQTEYSSWNYMLEQTGALTEGWHTVFPEEDGTVKIIGSLNHVALGAVGQWFYTDVLGIRRDENNPGYKHFYLEPQVGGGLTYAKGSYESIYGKIVSSWEVTENGYKFNFVIPANTSATITLPGYEYQNVELESGEYEFEVMIE